MSTVFTIIQIIFDIAVIIYIVRDLKK